MFRQYDSKILTFLFMSTLFSHECVELNPFDYGFCDMILGVAWTEEGCEYVSGCDLVNSEGEDHSEFFLSINGRM